MKWGWSAAFGVLAAFCLSACGGGGGGGVPADTLSYTGISAPAAIDGTNAEEIALAAWFGSDLGDTYFVPVLREGGGGKAGSRPLQAVSLVRTFRKVAESIGGKPAGSATGQARPSAVHGNSGRINGISGYVDISAYWDDQSLAIWGSLSFHDYEIGDGVVFSGTVGFSGTTTFYYDSNNVRQVGDVLDMTISFSFFTVTDGAGTIRVRGSLALMNDVLDVFPYDSSATLDLVVKDEITGKTIWIRDYTVTVTEGADIFGLYEDIRISGRIYLHDFGYVDIETTFVPFRVYEGDAYPSSGDLIVYGKTMGIGHCQAWLHVIDNTSYRVNYDADGDDSFEGVIFGTW